MTKEQLFSKWGCLSISLKNDLELVIATEIAKAQEAKLKHADQVTDQVTDQEQPKPNPIEQAYEIGEKIRHKNWLKNNWLKKYSNTEAIGENGKIWIPSYHFQSIKTMPDKWEIYTEPTEQTSSQLKLDNLFDRDRFEAMFRAVVASGVSDNEFIETEEILNQLDEYYASKEGGNEK